MKMENPSGVTTHRIEEFLQGPKILVSTSRLESLLSCVQLRTPPNVCSLSRMSSDISEARTGPVGQ
jgi:hypothetical protein